MPFQVRVIFKCHQQFFSMYEKKTNHRNDSSFRKYYNFFIEILLLRSFNYSTNSNHFSIGVRLKKNLTIFLISISIEVYFLSKLFSVCALSVSILILILLFFVILRFIVFMFITTHSTTTSTICAECMWQHMGVGEFTIFNLMCPKIKRRSFKECLYYYLYTSPQFSIVKMYTNFSLVLTLGKDQCIPQPNIEPLVN